MLIVPALWIVAWLAGREPLPRTPLNATLLLMFCMVLVSLWATFDIGYSLPKISGMVLGIGVFFAVAREAQRPRGLNGGLLVFLGIGLGIAALGIFSTSWLTSKVILFDPKIIIGFLPKLVTGLQGAESGLHPNEVAGTLIWVLPLMMAISATLLFSLRSSKNDEKKSSRWRLTGAALLFLTATCFVATVFLLTQSRGAYLGLTLIVPTLILIALPLKWRWVTLASLAILGLIAAMLLIQQWETVRAWVTDNSTVENTTFSLNSLEVRLEIWPRAIYGIQDFPITGMGMNVFRKAAPVLYPMFTIPPEFDIAHAHNEFLQAALDLGIPGLIAFIALYIIAFWMLRDIWRSGLRFPDFSISAKAIVLGLGGGLFAHLLYGLTDAVALGAKPGVLFWMLLGLIAGLYEQAHSAKSGSELRQ